MVYCPRSFRGLPAPIQCLWAETQFWGRSPGFLLSQVFRERYASMIGAGNKIILMDGKGPRVYPECG
jgi:hypothetical protein